MSPLSTAFLAWNLSWLGIFPGFGRLGFKPSCVPGSGRKTASAQTAFFSATPQIEGAVDEVGAKPRDRRSPADPPWCLCLQLCHATCRACLPLLRRQNHAWPLRSAAPSGGVGRQADGPRGLPNECGAATGAERDPALRLPRRRGWQLFRARTPKSWPDFSDGDSQDCV